MLTTVLTHYMVIMVVCSCTIIHSLVDYNQHIKATSNRQLIMYMYTPR